MIGGIARRNPFQRLVAVRATEAGHEPRVFESLAHSRGLVHDRPPERIEAPFLRHPHPAAGVHLARLEVEVAAVAVSTVVDALPSFVAFDPRKRRRDVRLVRRLVLAEPGVAVDPERRALRVGLKRDAARLETLVERDAERLHRLLQESFVIGLAWLEPGAIVVCGEVRHELDRVAREPGECGCRDRHSEPSGTGIYLALRDRDALALAAELQHLGR